MIIIFHVIQIILWTGNGIDKISREVKSRAGKNETCVRVFSRRVFISFDWYARVNSFAALCIVILDGCEF